jgi:hypothetical protein
MIFWENIDKNQKKVLKKLYKRSFTQLSTILYSFQAINDQIQPAFFSERRKYFESSDNKVNGHFNQWEGFTQSANAFFNYPC